jgi:hypothetical protein
VKWREVFSAVLEVCVITCLQSLQTSDGASSSVASLNQFAVLSDSESDIEDIGFYHNQTAIGPGSHLLSSTVTLTNIPLLSSKYTRSYLPQSK